MRTLYGMTRINGADFEDIDTKIAITLKYYKTINILAKTDYKKYGIQVIKKETNGKSKMKEKTCVKSISDSESVIEKILEILVTNTVTPISTNDILSDLKKNPDRTYNLKE